MSAEGGRTLVVGEALIDVVHPVGGGDGTGTEHVGGSPANVAIGVSALGHPVSLLTHLGPDARGARIREHLTSRGVGLLDAAPAARTSTATVALDATGVAEYTFDMTWELPPGPLPGGLGVDHVHTGSIAATMQPGASTLRTLLEEGRPDTTVSYDPNFRPGIMGEPHEARNAIEQLIGLSDVVKASEEDLGRLYGIDEHDPDALAQVAALWTRLGPSLVVLTLGPDGALVTVGGREPTSERVPGQAVTVADTVGAGDSFMAGLLSGLRDAGLLGGPQARARLRRADLAAVRPAIGRGVACSAWTVQRAGAAAPARHDLGLRPGRP